MVLEKKYDIKVNNFFWPMKWTPTGPLLSIEDKYLQPIEWIINAAAIGQIPEFVEMLSQGEQASTEGFFAVPLALDDIEAKDHAQWHELTGEELGEDVYMVGTTFTSEVVLPRQTLLQIYHALSEKRAEFPEPPLVWLFRLDPYYLCPAEGERELIEKLEERAVAFSCMQENETDESTLSATRKELLRDLESAGLFSEVYSKQKQEWLERWGACKLLAYHQDALKFMTHFRSRVRRPVVQETVPAAMLGASISTLAWTPQWV